LEAKNCTGAGLRCVDELVFRIQTRIMGRYW